MFSRVEVINILTKDGLVKVLGIAVCVSGALLMAIYRGPTLVGMEGTIAADGAALAGTWSSNAYSAQWLTTATLRFGFEMETWHLGVVCLIGNCFLMGAYLVIQVTQTLEL